MTEEVLNSIFICLLGGLVALFAIAILVGIAAIGLRLVWQLFKDQWEDLDD